MTKMDVSFDVSKWFEMKKKWLDLSPDHSMSITILGNSMLPFLRRGDRVQIKSSCYQQIEVGSVVVYLHWETNATIHRVIEINIQDGESVYQTKGDNNLFPDPYTLRKNEILGVVIKCIRLNLWERLRWLLHD